jgi:Ca-activated chloride channel homolog
MIITEAVSRIPSSSGDGACDAAGRYLLSVTRSSAEGSDQAHWPFELRYAVEEPLPAGTVPAASATGYGAAGPDAALPTEDPEDVVGGTGFNDATELTTGVYRDRLLPAQTRYFKVPVGWGQQLRYRVEFGNEPTLEGSPPSSYVRTTTFTPHRKPIPRGDFTVQRGYRGAPLAVDMGTVPVTWTNRWESAAAPQPVRMGGDYYIAVSLGPEAVRIARNAAIGVVLRVEVAGEELSGPEHQAPPLAAGEDGAGGAGGEDDDSATGGDKAAGRGAGWSGPVLAAAAGAGSVLLIAAVVVVIGRLRRRPPGGAQGAPGTQGRSEENGTMRGNW